MSDSSDVTVESELTAGSVFASYRVEQILGRGGMGVVYEATQLALERRVALKLIAPTLAADEGFRRRFEREARIAAALEHPHVLPVYEAGESDGLLYLSMRYVDGRDLGALLAAEGALAPARAASIVDQAAQALAAAHARGLVHRDIKPSNVLIETRDGHDHVWLADFGLTRSAAGGSLTQTGAFVGTVDYASPEQIRGEPLDPRSDVYSLGCLLFETLTGEPPFARESDVARLWAHMHDPPPAPSRVRPELGTRFDPIIARALAKAPDARHQTANDLGRAALAAAESRGPDEGPKPRTRQRSLRRAAVLAGLAVAIAISAFAAYALTRDSADPATVLPNSVVAIAPADNRVVADVAVGDQPTTLAVGGGSIWALNAGEQTISRIDLETRERVRTISTGTPASDIAYAGGTVWVANAETDSIYALDTQTGAVDTTLRLRIPHPRQGYVPPRVALASNGRRIWATGGDLTAVVVDAVSRRVERRLAGPPGFGSDASPAGPDIAIGEAGVWATDGRNEVLRLDVSPPSSVELGGFGPDDGITGVAVGREAVWAAGGTNTLWEVRPLPVRPEARSSVGGGPKGVAVGAGSVWTANAFDGTVSRFDPQSGRVTRIEVGGSPQAVLFAGGLLWVSVD